MIDDLSDKEQIELFKKWWKQYGLGILIAIVVGLSLGYGWRYWHQHQAQRNQQGSLMYMQLVGMKDPSTKQGQALVTSLDEGYRATPYPSMAHLLLAKQAVDKKQFKVAIQELDWVQQHGTVETFNTLALIRKARILTALKQYDEALRTLSTVDDHSFKAQIEIVRGDIYQARGERDRARRAYSSAQQALSTLGASDPILAMKLVQVGGDVVGKEVS